MRTSFRVLRFDSPARRRGYRDRRTAHSQSGRQGARRHARRLTRKKALNVPEYSRWRSIGSVSISDDGTWATWSYTQRNVDDTLFVKNLNTDSVITIPRASGPQVSEDAKWLAYAVAPAGANRQAAGGGGGGGRGAQGAAAGGARRTELRNLATGAVLSWDNTQSFAFNKGATALLVRKARAPSAAAPAATPAETPRRRRWTRRSRWRRGGARADGRHRSHPAPPEGRRR